MARPPADNNRNLLRRTRGRPDHAAVHFLDVRGKCQNETAKTFGGEIVRVVKKVCQEMLHICRLGRHRQDGVRAAGRTVFGTRPVNGRRPPVRLPRLLSSRPALPRLEARESRPRAYPSITRMVALSATVYKTITNGMRRSVIFLMRSFSYTMMQGPISKIGC